MRVRSGAGLGSYPRDDKQRIAREDNSEGGRGRRCLWGRGCDRSGGRRRGWQQSPRPGPFRRRREDGAEESRLVLWLPDVAVLGRAAERVGVSRRRLAGRLRNQSFARPRGRLCRHTPSVADPRPLGELSRARGRRQRVWTQRVRCTARRVADAGARDRGCSDRLRRRSRWRERFWSRGEGVAVRQRLHGEAELAPGGPGHSPPGQRSERQRSCPGGHRSSSIGRSGGDRSE